MASSSSVPRASVLINTTQLLEQSPTTTIATTSTTSSAMERWQDLHADRSMYTTFDDPDLPPPTFWVRYGSAAVLAGLLGILMSLGTLVYSFHLAGYPGSTLPENLVSVFSGWLHVMPLAHFFAFCDPQLSDVKWYACFSGWSFVGFVGGRCLLEQLTGAQQRLLGLYALGMGIYSVTFPILPMLLRVAGCKDWCVPWRWSVAVLRMVPKRELAYILLMQLAAIFITGYVILDSTVLASLAVPHWVNKWVRPLGAWTLRRIMQSAFWRISQLTQSPSAKYWAFLLVFFGLAFPLVRLPTLCRSWEDFAVIEFFDWSAFVVRTVVYWDRSRPEAPLMTAPEPHFWAINARRRSSAGIRPSLDAQSPPAPEPQAIPGPCGFTCNLRAVSHAGVRLFRQMTQLPPPLPDMNPHDFHGYCYMMENFGLTSSYMTALCMYSIFKLLHQVPACLPLRLPVPSCFISGFFLCCWRMGAGPR